MSKTTLDQSPWYRQFWPWFLILLPATVVVAGLTTVFIAVNQADSVVSDDYYRDGLGINVQLDEEQRARTLAIRADVLLTSTALELTLSGQLEHYPEVLELNLSHPLEQTRDQKLRLSHRGNGHYGVELGHDLTGRWYVQLKSVPAAWSLRTEVSLVPERALRIAANADQ